MSDALISPTVGGAMWVTAAATTAYCAKRIREEDDPAKIPLMGVAGAFVFAGQMLNFTIPGTGSSGHIGGGLILALLLGPEAAFLVMASILTVQALFFADGGLLALGCNIFNLGFWPAFLAFPLIYKQIVGSRPTPLKVLVGSVLGAVVALQLGAFGVVLETARSGVSLLPFSAFAMLMQPIHLAIGVVEGLVTAGVAMFVLRAQPELLERTASRLSVAGLRLKTVLASLIVAAVVAGAGISWFASSHADGLEWSIERITGTTDIHVEGPLHAFLANLQGRTAVLPDYGFPVPGDNAPKNAAPGHVVEPVEGPGREEPGSEGSEREPAWPNVDPGASTSGLVGAGIVLALTMGVGFVLKQRAPSGKTPVKVL